ncbi:hypothetical protein [Sharpea azabuensis]|uniref:hypothetical protein n=1 Tax=Sharpea azabuensis TaxID=322505 RepID=UPI000E930A27|nr:hypothetical protein [Sharpea azabuensis]HAJ14699.1 hypothetical protein [Erysipelotrichaceae bacterium]MDD6513116.1 hypothetical protein [Sharpea azabuensis]HAV19356.1 hypothetical protein [Erysipelotrichaceae bacterium]HBG85039.1 hypothetical protein [Erysipelotrichaceae bacterium]HBZ50706.1 hypothetical protein [Erysipelotrichaceae bacterium]
MAFFDDLKTAATTAGKLSKDTLETTKLKGEVVLEERDMNRAFAKIGKYYYDIALQGLDLPDEVKNLVSEIDEHKERIDVLNRQINRIKDNKM